MTGSEDLGRCRFCGDKLTQFDWTQQQLGIPWGNAHYACYTAHMKWKNDCHVARFLFVVVLLLVGGMIWSVLQFFRWIGGLP